MGNTDAMNLRHNRIGPFSRNAKFQLPRIRKLLETVRRIETKPVDRHERFRKIESVAKMTAWAKQHVGFPMPVPNLDPSPGRVCLPRLFGIGIGEPA